MKSQGQCGVFCVSGVGEGTWEEAWRLPTHL